MDYVKAFWPVLLTLLGFAVWLARLEGRVKALERQFVADSEANRCDHRTIKDLLYSIRDVFVRKGWMGPKDIAPTRYDDDSTTGKPE